jgi:predicted Zn-dependent protease
VLAGLGGLWLIWLMASVPTAASAGGAGIESTYVDHTRAVELARAGRYDEALAILFDLLERFPDDYPLQRDAIVILTWKGDCPEALRRFERIRHHEALEP